MNLTHEQLLELLHYDPETGHLTWKQDGPNRKAGQRAGHIVKRHNGRPSRCISINGTTYPEARIVWFWMRGTWLRDTYWGQIYHLNCDKTDNSWANLKRCNRTQLSMDRLLAHDKTSKYTGVHYLSWDKCWRARVTVNKRTITVGQYQTEMEAVRARDAYIKEHRIKDAKLNLPDDLSF